MWRRILFTGCLWAAIVAVPSDAETQVLLGFVDSDTRFAVQGAVDGAAARLGHPACQEVFADFADDSGQDLRPRLLAKGKSAVEAFATLRVVDSRPAPQCRTGTTLAFTTIRSTVIHVCGAPFMKRSLRNRMAAEIILIHEFLHTLGLGENPPTSDAITAQVMLRCGG